MCVTEVLPGVLANRLIKAERGKWLAVRVSFACVMSCVKPCFVLCCGGDKASNILSCRRSFQPLTMKDRSPRLAGLSS